MLGLLRLAARLALIYALRRMAQASVLFTVAGIFALIALLGFSTALAIWLAQLLGPIAAALLVGGAGLVLALIFALLARARLRSASPLQSPAALALLAEMQRSSPVELWGPAVLSAILAAVLGGKPKE